MRQETGMDASVVFNLSIRANYTQKYKGCKFGLGARACACFSSLCVEQEDCWPTGKHTALAKVISAHAK